MTCLCLVVLVQYSSYLDTIQLPFRSCDNKIDLGMPVLELTCDTVSQTQIH